MKSIVSIVDAAYQARRERGETGWGTWKGIKELWDIYEDFLQTEDYMPVSVLDLGCGAGEFSQLLTKQGYQVTGLDFSKAAIAWAECRFSEEDLTAEWVVGNALDLNVLAGRQFDVVFDGRWLHCVVGEDRIAALKRALGWTRHYFVVNTMCGDPEGELQNQFDAKTRHLFMKDGRPQRFIGTSEGLREELEEAGFEIVKHKVTLRRESDELDDFHALCRPKS